MKKILLVFTVFMFAIAGTVSAQNKYILKANEAVSFNWGTSTASGAQKVQVPGNKGTLKFKKNGDKFTNVIFIDSVGKTHRLKTVVPGTNGAPETSCKNPLPDACFATADKNIGMCMCKPDEISSGGPYMISLLLPAVQKVREAAQRK